MTVNLDYYLLLPSQSFAIVDILPAIVYMYEEYCHICCSLSMQFLLHVYISPEGYEARKDLESADLKRKE